MIRSEMNALDSLDKALNKLGKWHVLKCAKTGVTSFDSWSKDFNQTS